MNIPKLGMILPIVGMLGCTVTGEISTSPDPDARFVQDLRDADYNLTESQRLGILPANDPGAQCVHAVLTQVDVVNESFTPRTSGVVSGASIVYIRAQQAKALAAAARISPDCEALVGRIVIDAARVTGRAARLVR